MTMTKEFAYTARNARGKVVKGRVEAASESAAVGKLRTLGVAPIELREAAPATGLNAEIRLPGLQKGAGLKDLAVMSRQLATMISSGLSLLRALSVLAQQTENKALQTILADVRSDVETGASLSVALARHAKTFPPLMISLVTAGETGGFLERSLNSIADTFEKEVKLRDTVKSALTYPVMVLLLAILAVIGMLIFIVPVFENMFAGLDSELPAPTQFLVFLSSIMPWVMPPLIIGLIVFMIWWRANKNTDAVRRRVDPVKFKLPVFGNLFKKVALARFSRNFSTMIGAGVPILQALAVVGDTSGNWVISQASRNVADSVRQGKSIAAPLAAEPVFPSMVTQMIAVGEDAGSLEQMLDKIADFYEAEVESTTEALTSLIEPLMIAVIGVVIGGMIVALYMPVFSIFENIG
jgi:type IV pilus assembly protein PilC